MKPTLVPKRESTNFRYQNNKTLPYYELYEHLSYPIVVVALDYKIEYLNRAAKEFYNLTDNIVDKQCNKEFDCNFTHIPQTCPIQNVLNNNQTLEMKAVNHLGRSDCYLRAFPINNSDGKIISVGIEELSNLYSATDQVIELESRFKKTVELAADAIFLIGEGYIIHFVNSAAVVMIGSPIEDIIGKDFRVYLNDADVINFLEEMYESPESHNSVCYYSEDSVLFGRDKKQTVEMCITKAIEKEDQIRMYLYLRDITEEKNLQNHLMQTNEFLWNLIQRSVDGIIAADMKGKIIIYNESAEKLLGYTTEEAINNIHITNIYRPGIAHEVMKMLRSENYGGFGKMETIEWKAVSKYGDEIPCNLSAALIYDKNGQEVASVGIFSDLRERKRMEKELEETHLKLVQSEKMSSLGKLAAGIAHEINNPLAGIVMFANMMLEELTKEDEKKEDLKKIVSEADRCKNIVKGLLEFSRQTDYQMSHVDINRLLEQGMSLLENQAIFHNIQIIKDYDKTLPLVKCDSARLNQVFVNIILNAVDAIGNKGIFTVRTKYKHERNRVDIEFTDTGCGITEEIMPKIFDPFFTTKEVGKGTGLGLSVSYGIVKDHGGIIDLKSKKGAGTTFTIKLPVEN